MLFCKPGTKVIEFMPSVEMLSFFWLISENLSLTYAVQFCPAVDGDSLQASLNVDIGKLKMLYCMVAVYCYSSGEIGTGAGEITGPSASGG